MSGSGLRIGICEEAYENFMNHKSISWWCQNWGWGGMCEGKIFAPCYQIGKKILLYTLDSLRLLTKFCLG